MLSILARGCPSWTPVKGWQDLGGCWSPPPAMSWWTPRHIAATFILTMLFAVAIPVFAAVLRYRLMIRRDIRRAKLAAGVKARPRWSIR